MSAIDEAKNAIADAAATLAGAIPDAEEAGDLPGKAEAVKTLAEAVQALEHGPSGGRYHNETEYHYHTHPHEMERGRRTGFGGNVEP